LTFDKNTVKSDNIISDPEPELEEKVRARLDSLTKPAGSLGRLEEIALRFALIRREEMPSPARKGMFVFVGDHGVVEEGVSRYPQQVTRQMMRNFVDGGAAINVLCRRLQIRPTIIDVGACGPPVPGVIDRKIAMGTRNFAREAAMTGEEAMKALEVGRSLAEEASYDYDLVGLGEMGIGNTRSATAILSVYSGRTPYETAGPGAGLDSQGVRRKAEVIDRALRMHSPDPSDGIGILAAVGGFEIASIAGFLIGASRLRLPVVLDGFSCCAGALVARAIQPDALATAFYSHISQEPGHRLMLDLLDAHPYADLGMRLGEGSGAALAMGVIDAAVRLYREMATFSEAGVTSPGAERSDLAG
jgi:nicotinate-nucleotide--dimethylbenzimidazole phosphoribosyltransferase